MRFPAGRWRHNNIGADTCAQILATLDRLSPFQECSCSPHLVQSVAQLLKKLLKGIYLIDADCRSSQNSQCLCVGQHWLQVAQQTQLVLLACSQCVSCASCSWLAKLPPSLGFEPMQPIHYCYRIAAAALKKQSASCFNRDTTD